MLLCFFISQKCFICWECRVGKICAFKFSIISSFLEVFTFGNIFLEGTFNQLM